MVAGLGNPGKEYKATRHNVGYRAADKLAARLGESLGTKAGRGSRAAKFKRKFLGAFSVLPLPDGEETAILKPTTFMNRSGRSVIRAVRELGVAVNELVVAHDDIDLPLGRIRIKFGGGSGGHKGVESIREVLGTPDFLRLRIGIDRPNDDDVSDYVLEEFTPSESVILENEVLLLAVDALLVILSHGADAAMNEFNG